VADPTDTDPDKYRLVFENERVRVLEYRDEPGAKTSPHDHPDSVMITLSGFQRRLAAGGQSRDVTTPGGQVSIVRRVSSSVTWMRRTDGLMAPSTNQRVVISLLRPRDDSLIHSPGGNE